MIKISFSEADIETLRYWRSCMANSAMLTHALRMRPADYVAMTRKGNVLFRLQDPATW